jgi:hypothetical protein
MNRVVLSFGFAIAALLSAVAAAETPNEQADERRVIPLSAIVTTSPQNGLQHVRDALQQEDCERKSAATVGYLRQIQSVANGSSNVFLVDATNICDAISASFSIFLGSRSADTPAPVNTPDPIRGNHWLVVYLGLGPSNPTWWIVESVTVEGSQIALTYRKSPPSPTTADEHPYYYWIDLGALDPGFRELQLLDADSGSATLARRVEVAPRTAKGSAR